MQLSRTDYEVDPGQVELHRLVHGRYQLVPANERGHYPIENLGIELGIWQGRYAEMDLPWLRFYDDKGVMLPLPEDRAEQAEQRIDEIKRIDSDYFAEE